MMGIFQMKGFQMLRQHFGHRVIAIPSFVGRYDVPFRAVAGVDNHIIYLHVVTPLMCYYCIIFCIFPSLVWLGQPFLYTSLLFFAGNVQKEFKHMGTACFQMFFHTVNQVASVLQLIF